MSDNIAEARLSARVPADPRLAQLPSALEALQQAQEGLERLNEPRVAEQTASSLQALRQAREGLESILDASEQRARAATARAGTAGEVGASQPAATADPDRLMLPDPPRVDPTIDGPEAAGGPRFSNC